MDAPEPILAEFDYTISRRTAVGLFLLVTMGAVAVSCLAFAPGLLGRPPARPDQWPVLACVAILSPVAVFTMGYWVYLAFTAERRIRLTPSHALIPDPTRWQFLGAERAIPLADIRSVQLGQHRVHGITAYEMLRISHPEGSLVLISLMFRSKQEFRRFAETLQRIIE